MRRKREVPMTSENETTTTGTVDRCGNVPCRWCDLDDQVCRYCDGTGWWEPERPKSESGRVVDWERVREPCRMCGNTGKEHNPLTGSAPAAS